MTHWVCIAGWIVCGIGWGYCLVLWQLAERRVQLWRHAAELLEDLARVP